MHIHRNTIQYKRWYNTIQYMIQYNTSQQTTAKLSIVAWRYVNFSGTQRRWSVGSSNASIGESVCNGERWSNVKSLGSSKPPCEQWPRVEKSRAFTLLFPGWKGDRCWHEKRWVRPWLHGSELAREASWPGNRAGGLARFTPTGIARQAGCFLDAEHAYKANKAKTKTRWHLEANPFNWKQSVRNRLKRCKARYILAPKASFRNIRFSWLPV